MKEVTTSIIENKALLQGDNHFETGAILLTAGQEVKEGAYLKRWEGKFALLTDIEKEEVVAIVPVTTKNTQSTPVTVSLRACIDGKVRADMLHINGTPANADEIDLLRKYGFTPIYANDMSRTE